MQRSPTRFLTLFTTLLLVCGCESNNERVRRTIRETVDAITPEAILQAAAELDKRNIHSDETLLPIETLPAALAAFEPVEVYYRMNGSYLIVTAKWVSHRSGLRIAAPDEVIPPSTENLIHEKLADRLYLYQD